MHSLDTIHSVYEWTLRLACIFVLVYSYEYLYNWRMFKDNHFLGWQALQHQNRLTRSGISGIILQKIFSFPQVLVFYLIPPVCALLYLLPIFDDLNHWWILAIFLCQVVARIRHPQYFMSGCDPMAVVVLGTVSIYLWFGLQGSQTLSLVGIWFIALHGSLSYLVSGVHKFRNPQMRQGVALNFILLKHNYYSNLKIPKFLQSPYLGKTITWTIIAFEWLFPLSLLGGLLWSHLFVMGGLLFHFMITLVMGLPRYMWIWWSTYPSIIYCAMQLNP